MAKARASDAAAVADRVTVVMIQSMAGENLSYIPGDQVQVRPYVAEAWAAADIARPLTAEDPQLPAERIQTHPDAEPAADDGGAAAE